MLIYSMSVSVDGFIADRERSSRRRERAVSERLLLRCAKSRSHSPFKSPNAC
jgi:hypothetical protein